MFANFYRQSYAKKLASKKVAQSQEKKLINGQLNDDKAIGKDGLRLRTVVDENCNTTSYSSPSISVTQKNGKKK